MYIDHNDGIGLDIYNPGQNCWDTWLFWETFSINLLLVCTITEYCKLVLIFFFLKKKNAAAVFVFSFIALLEFCSFIDGITYKHSCKRCIQAK